MLDVLPGVEGRPAVPSASGAEEVCLRLPGEGGGFDRARLWRRVRTWCSVIRGLQCSVRRPLVNFPAIFFILFWGHYYHSF